MQVCDADNDGDMDVWMKTGHSDFAKDYLMINEGDQWKQKDFPINMTNDEFLIDDLNHDGLYDILWIKNEKTNIFNDTAYHWYYNNTINIAYGKGNMEFDIQHQVTKTMNGILEQISLVDMDMDGDKDLVALCTRREDYYSEITVFLNGDEDRPDLTFTSSMKDRHVRGGSVYNFEWIGRDLIDVLNQGYTSNVSISFTGKDGPYESLVRDLDRSWADVVIPDVPTKEAFIRVQISNRTCYDGPIIIHDRSDWTSFLVSEEPEQDSVLIGGEKARFVLHASKYYDDNPVSVKIWTKNRTYDLGSHDILAGQRISFEWSVPDGIREDNCTLLFSYRWKDKVYNHSDEKTFSIVPTSELPGSMIIRDLFVPVNVTTTFNFTVLSRGGQDITAVCELTPYYTMGNFDLYKHNNGSFSIYPKKLGNYWIEFTASRYGRNITQTMNIIVHRDIARIYFMAKTWDFHPGDTFVLDLVAADHYNVPVNVSKDKISVSVEGSGSLVSFEYPEVTVFCSKAGWMDINATISVPYLNVSGNRRELVSSYFSSLNITSSSDTVFVGDNVQTGVTVKKYDGSTINDADISWMIHGPGEPVDIHGSVCNIKAIGSGNISASARVRYLDEIVTVTKTIRSYHPLSHFIVEDLPEYFEVGTQTNITFSLMDANGSSYELPYQSSVSSSNPSIVQVEKDGNNVTISGVSEGETELVLHGTSEGRTVQTSFPIKVVSIPRNLSITTFDVIRKGETVPIRIEVRDLKGEMMSNYSLDLDHSGVTFERTDEGIEVIGNAIGNGFMNITVSGYGSILSEEFEFDVIHWADRISIESNEVSFYESDAVSVNLFLADKDGETITDAIIELFVDDGLNAEYLDGIMILSSDIPGDYSVHVAFDYYGSTLKDEILVSVLERTALDDILIENMGNNIYKVKAIDQWGGDITSLCQIDVVGDHERIDHSSFRAVSGSIEITVSYNGTIMKRTIDTPIQQQGRKFPFVLLFLPLAVIAILAITLLYLRKRRDSIEE